MTYDEFKKVRIGQRLAVIRYGDECVVKNISRKRSMLYIRAYRYGVGYYEGWYKYNELG